MIDSEENFSMKVVGFVVSDQSNIGHEGEVDSLCDIDCLEKLVVALLLVEVGVYCIFVEHILFDIHQSLDIL